MLSFIVTKSKNNIIEKDGKVFWNIKEQIQFDELTVGNTVIMDKKTFESIGRPLPNRLNLVISKDHKYKGNNIITVNNLEQALYLSTDKSFIIGGYNLYKEALSLVDTMYITKVNIEIEDDNTYFPKFNEEDFNKHLLEKNDDFKRYIYTRKR